jgi:hypothetical protein
MAADACNPAWKDRPALTVVPIRTTMRRYPTAPCQNDPEGKCASLPVADFNDVKRGADEGEELFKKEIETKGTAATCAEADAILTKIEAIK